MLKKLFYTTLAFLVACSNEIDLPESKPNNNQDLPSTVRSIDEAVALATSTLISMDQSQTKTSDRKLADIRIYGNVPTRSNEEEPSAIAGYYIINFANNSGFAIISSDRRIQSIIAASPDGQLNLADTLFNVGLTHYLHALPKQIDGFNDPTLSNSAITPDPNPGSYGKVEVAPLFTSVVRKWDQKHPYNLYCYNASGEKCPVGCAAVAAGKIMSYYKWPKSYKTYTFDWNAMRTVEGAENTARLLKELGNSENLNIGYSPMGSGASPSNVQRTFYNMEYSFPQRTSFSENDVVNKLKSPSPIYIYGYDLDLTPNGGHAWVLDGLYTVYPANINDDPNVKPKYYIHCDWGWGGVGNGYFSFASDMVGGRPFKTDSEDTYEFIDYIFEQLGVFYDFYINGTLTNNL